MRSSATGWPEPPRGGVAMKNGFKVMDSDLHTMEPDGLGERYLDEPFKKLAPKFLRGRAQPYGREGRLARGRRSVIVPLRPTTAQHAIHRFLQHPLPELLHALPGEDFQRVEPKVTP